MPRTMDGCIERTLSSEDKPKDEAEIDEADASDPELPAHREDDDDDDDGLKDLEGPGDGVYMEHKLKYVEADLIRQLCADVRDKWEAPKAAVVEANENGEAANRVFLIVFMLLIGPHKAFK